MVVIAITSGTAQLSFHFGTYASSLTASVVGAIPGVFAVTSPVADVLADCQHGPGPLSFLVAGVAHLDLL